MYSIAMPSCNLQHPMRALLSSPRAGYRNLKGLGDNCVVDARTGLRICGDQATAAQIANGTIPATTGITTTCSVGMPRYRGAGYIEWKPFDKDHKRRYAFQYHSGEWDQYSCIPGIADCNSKYNDMMAGPHGEWQAGRLPQDESRCTTTTPTLTTSAGNVAVVSTNGTTTFPVVTDGGSVSAAWPASFGTGYGSSESSSAKGSDSSLGGLWSNLPTWGKIALGAGGGLLAMKYMQGGRR